MDHSKNSSEYYDDQLTKIWAIIEAQTQNNTDFRQRLQALERNEDIAKEARAQRDQRFNVMEEKLEKMEQYQRARIATFHGDIAVQNSNIKRLYNFVTQSKKDFRVSRTGSFAGYGMSSPRFPSLRKNLKYGRKRNRNNSDESLSHTPLEGSFSPLRLQNSSGKLLQLQREESLSPTPLKGNFSLLQGKPSVQIQEPTELVDAPVTSPVMTDEPRTPLETKREMPPLNSAYTPSNTPSKISNAICSPSGIFDPNFAYTSNAPGQSLANEMGIPNWIANQSIVENGSKELLSDDGKSVDHDESPSEHVTEDLDVDPLGGEGEGPTIDHDVLAAGTNENERHFFVDSPHPPEKDSFTDASIVQQECDDPDDGQAQHSTPSNPPNPLCNSDSPNTLNILDHDSNFAYQSDAPGPSPDCTNKLGNQSVEFAPVDLNGRPLIVLNEFMESSMVDQHILGNGPKESHSINGKAADDVDAHSENTKDLEIDLLDGEKTMDGALDNMDEGKEVIQEEYLFNSATQSKTELNERSEEKGFTFFDDAPTATVQLEPGNTTDGQSENEHGDGTLIASETQQVIHTVVNEPSPNSTACFMDVAVAQHGSNHGRHSGGTGVNKAWKWKPRDFAWANIFKSLPLGVILVIILITATITFIGVALGVALCVTHSYDCYFNPNYCSTYQERNDYSAKIMDLQ